MLIRSQDGTELINFNNATSISVISEYGNKKGIVVRLIGEDRWTILGHYSDEKALKVLDMIDEFHYQYINTQNPAHNEITLTVFQMPKEN